MDARSPQVTGLASPRRGADHIAPDSAGQNFYAIDRALRDLLRVYLSAEDFPRLEGHFDRLGALAGGRLDELARLADQNQPVLHPRDRFGRDETGSTTIPPIARWSASPSAIFSSMP